MALALHTNQTLGPSVGYSANDRFARYQDQGNIVGFCLVLGNFRKNGASELPHGVYKNGFSCRTYAANACAFCPTILTPLVTPLL